jgi:hypothetical protein
MGDKNLLDCKSDAASATNADDGSMILWPRYGRLLRSNVIRDIKINRRKKRSCGAVSPFEGRCRSSNYKKVASFIFENKNRISSMLRISYLVAFKF